MNCPIKKEDLIAYMYGEINEQKKSIIEEHIKDCSECKKEVEFLKKDIDLLKKWKVDVPSMDCTFIKQNQSFMNPIKHKFIWFSAKPTRIGYSFAAVAASILIILSLLNFKFEYNQSGVSISMSIWGEEEKNIIVEELLSKLDDSQRIIENLVLSAVTVSEDRMRDERIKLVSELIDGIQRQRTIDLLTIEKSMENLHMYANEGFRQNNEILGELFYLTKTDLSR